MSKVISRSRSNEERKRRAIDRILDNETFMDDSGVIVQLTKTLLKLSASDLENLAMVIDAKE
jgi:hypothetical protein